MSIFYFLFGGNKFGPYFSMTLMLPLVMFKTNKKNPKLASQ
jgi:hypothetical protein